MNVLCWRKALSSKLNDNCEHKFYKFNRECLKTLMRKKKENKLNICTKRNQQRQKKKSFVLRGINWNIFVSLQVPAKTQHTMLQRHDNGVEWKRLVASVCEQLRVKWCQSTCQKKKKCFMSAWRGSLIFSVSSPSRYLILPKL